MAIKYNGTLLSEIPYNDVKVYVVKYNGTIVYSKPITVSAAVVTSTGGTITVNRTKGENSEPTSSIEETLVDAAESTGSGQAYFGDTLNITLTPTDQMRPNVLGVWSSEMKHFVAWLYNNNLAILKVIDTDYYLNLLHTYIINNVAREYNKINLEVTYYQHLIISDESTLPETLSYSQYNTSQYHVYTYTPTLTQGWFYNISLTLRCITTEQQEDYILDCKNNNSWSKTIDNGELDINKHSYLNVQWDGSGFTIEHGGRGIGVFSFVIRVNHSGMFYYDDTPV